jgi:hypothetical protein
MGACTVTAETYEIENRRGALPESKAIEPYRNPSYPQRDHFSERARLLEALRTCEERVAEARRKLDADSRLASDAGAVRFYHQLLGVRDQVAECARRMPLEAGELYTEDKEILERAIAAGERVWQRWEKVS